MTARTVRWGGIAAIVFVVLIVVTIFAAGAPPQADDSADKIREYFVEHRGGLLLVNFLGMVAVPFGLWFAVMLRELVRGDREANVFATLSLVGFIVTAAAALVGGALQAAPVYVDGAAEVLSDDTLRIVYIAQVLIFAALSAGGIAFGLGAALAIQRTQALPNYTMWLAFLVAIGNLLAMFAVFGPGAMALGLAGFITFGLFVLVTGIVMLAGKAAPVPVTAAAT
jgi:hypothetical protein